MLPHDEQARRSWDLRSSMRLEDFLEDHDAVLAAFGLEQPIEPGRERAFLLDHARRKRAEGLNMHTEGHVTVPMPDGTLSRMAGLPGCRLLASAARVMADALGCEQGQAVRFLLTGRPFTLPWVDVEMHADRLGPSFTIHVGSSDVAAEDVRVAYLEAVRALLGTEKGYALPAHVVPMVLEEAEGRRAGETWRQRWHRWQRYAEQWGFGTRYESVESYRNYVNRKASEHEWIRGELDEADYERASRKEAERG